MTIIRKDQQFMTLALEAGQIFSTCSRRQYCAIIVDEHYRVVSLGYNGVPPGHLHCYDGGCERALTKPLGTGHGTSYGDCKAQHAEAGALIRANHSEIVGSTCTLYINGPPCWDCSKLIACSGIKRLVYLEDPAYGEMMAKNKLELLTGLEVIEMKPRVDIWA